MQPIETLSSEEARGLSGLLFDLDDTLLDHGQLTEAAYSALFRLRESGLTLVAVTGRPAGWGALLARQWPIDGCVTENGAVALIRTGHVIQRLDPVDERERRRRRRRIAEIVAALGERFPDLQPADDVEARTSDFTFDIGERRQIDRAIVDQAADLAADLGARTTRSSVHLHVTLDGSDKAPGVLDLLHHLRGVDRTVARFRYAFIGDSQNDETCFAAFRTSIGVHNLTGRPSVPPRFITRASYGAGFAEAASAIVERRARARQAGSRSTGRLARE